MHRKSKSKTYFIDESRSSGENSITFQNRKLF